MTDRPNAADNMAAQFDRQEEMIVWHHVAEEMPDADMTVLVVGIGFDEVDMAFHSVDFAGDPCWVHYEGWEFGNDMVVTHWAHMPEGPRKRKGKE